MKLLIVEDDARVADFLERGLRAEGYGVTRAATGEGGLALARREEWSVILLDVMLPDLSGVDICQTLRSEGRTTPILILTAMGTTEEKVLGLRCGADDYMTKPFAFDELLARLEALRRRGLAWQPSTVLLQVGDLVMNREKMTVHRAGVSIALTAKELALLELFMATPGRVLSRQRILSNVWAASEDPLTNIVDVYMLRLRSKIDKGHAVAMIKTVRGFGYKIDDTEN